jgi:hypothetical protein
MKWAKMSRIPLASLMEIVGVLVQNYEDEHVPELIAN